MQTYPAASITLPVPAGQGDRLDLGSAGGEVAADGDGTVPLPVLPVLPTSRLQTLDPTHVLLPVLIGTVSQPAPPLCTPAGFHDLTSLYGKTILFLAWHCL